MNVNYNIHETQAEVSNIFGVHYRSDVSMMGEDSILPWDNKYLELADPNVCSQKI